MGRLLALVSIMTAVLALGVAPGAAQDKAAQDKAAWDNLVAAAQREGSVVVKGPPHAELRKQFPAAFKARYGITVEYLGGRTNEHIARLRAERSAGQKSSVDVNIGGIQSMATIFYREKMLEPLRPALLMPEVVDGSKWKKGELWFADPEQTYILRLSNSVQQQIHINTTQVKPGDLKTAQDLLNPKWRGKISMGDPTLTGSSANQAAIFYVLLGEDFVRKLYVDQKPTISRDTRQMTDWLLRGSHPIAFDVDRDQLDDLRKEGMPITPTGNDFPDLPATLSAESGMVVLFENSQHAAAGKLFLNWLASKEGLEIWSRATLTASTRNDIDEASFLPPEIIPRAGVKYFDSYDWTFTTTDKEKVRLWMKDLMGR
jgi:iron(III) transport system substrate-binding protein